MSSTVALMPLCSPREPRNVLAAGIALTVFACLSAAAGLSSRGFLEGDAITHFIGARNAVENPRLLVGIWGRPVVTSLYALPAYFIGVSGVRLTALLLALVAAIATYRVAVNQRYRFPAVAVIALCAQPLFFLHSFSELTELPFATLLILAFWAYQENRLLPMALLVGLLPATRPEGFGFIAIAAAGLVAHRRWRLLPVLVAPLFIWSFAGWAIYGYPDYYGWGNWSWLRWLQFNWPYAVNSTYVSGPLLFWRTLDDGTLQMSFLARLPIVVSPLFFPFFWFGLGGRNPHPGPRGEGGEGPHPGPLPQAGEGEADRLPRGEGEADPLPGGERGAHRARCQILIALLPLMVLVVHSVLWWRGKQGSSGELRYLLVVGPFWALLCARGWEWAFVRLKLRRPLLLAGLAALAPLAVNLKYPVVPIPAYENEILGKAVVDWYRGDATLRMQYPNIMASPPSIPLLLNVRKSDPFRLVYLSRTRVALNADAATRGEVAGSIIIWDQGFGSTNANQELAVPCELIEHGGWIHLGTFRCRATRFEVFVSALAADGRPSDQVLEPPAFFGHRELSMKQRR